MLAGYQGLSWTVVVVLIVVAIYHFITTQTVLGRHIYAVGGNPEAAELSGISVKKIIYVVFGSMGMLSALSGILFASRLQSATTTAGTLFELDAIAAAYVGGVSAAGGVGKVIGSLIGALVMMSLTSGMNLMGIDISLPVHRPRRRAGRRRDLRCNHPQPGQVTPQPLVRIESRNGFYV